MERTPIQSTLIESIAYDEREGVLEVWFTNGTHYRYFQVEPEVVEEMMAADSKGRYFNDFIREGYLYRQVL